MRIGQLPSIVTSALTDYVATEQSGATLKASLQGILNLFKSNITPADIGAVSADLLWTNQSPTSSFAAQTVALDLSGYDAVLVEFSLSAGGSIVKPNIYFKGHGIYLDYTPWPNGTTVNLAGRTMEVTASGVIFGSGLAMAQGSAQTNIDNRYVPLYIYGIKGF